MTKQRRLIKQIIEYTGEHMTAEQIFLTAKQKMPCIAVGTVYRNLGQMVAEGVIRKVAVSDGPDRYDKTLRPHHHAECVRCHKVFDIEQADGLSLPDVINGSLRVLGVDLIVRCVCEECAGKHSQHN